MAAWDKTLVLIDEASANAALLTYMHNAYVDFNQLLKIVPAVKVGSATETASKAHDISVEDFPGGVVASFHLQKTRVDIEYVPLMIGRGRAQGEGLALYKIHTAPPRTDPVDDRRG